MDSDNKKPDYQDKKLLRAAIRWAAKQAVDEYLSDPSANPANISWAKAHPEEHLQNHIDDLTNSCNPIRSRLANLASADLIDAYDAYRKSLDSRFKVGTKEGLSK